MVVAVDVGVGVSVGGGVTVGVDVTVVAGKLLSIIVPKPSLSAMVAKDALVKSKAIVRSPCAMARSAITIETVVDLDPARIMAVPLWAV